MRGEIFKDNTMTHQEITDYLLSNGWEEEGNALQSYARCFYKSNGDYWVCEVKVTPSNLIVFSVNHTPISGGWYALRSGYMPEQFMQGFEKIPRMIELLKQLTQE